MRIYSMTATFGKLRNEILVLQPGLNILHAPNEWGKSTWSAFLLAMFYGLDTRAKSTKTALADKDRYAPWSGEPMSGSIDLCWNGRDITIQRSTRGRIPMGQFRAFETESGLPVPELTAANCGEMLLGVEKSVFIRTGFVRLNQMAIAQDETMSRRLQSLVTTGDENPDGQRLEKDLKELRNRIRYNRTGLLPQKEEELAIVMEKCRERKQWEEQSRKQRERLAMVKERIRALENHQAALEYAQTEKHLQRLAQARETMEQAEECLADKSRSCANLPSFLQAREKLQALENFCRRWETVQAASAQLTEKLPEPTVPEAFAGIAPSDMYEKLQTDIRHYEQLTGSSVWLVPMVLSGIFLVIAGILLWQRQWLFAAGSGILSMLLLVLGIGKRSSRAGKRKKLEEKYGSSDPSRWERVLCQYEQDCRNWSRSQAEYSRNRGDWEQRKAALETERRSLCGSQEPEAVRLAWQQVCSHWQALGEAEKQAHQARAHYEALQAVVRPAKAPTYPDELSFDTKETAILLEEARLQQQNLSERIGMLRGRMEAMGDLETLERQEKALRGQIRKLEDTYAAVVLGLETLTRAKQELQRRFAPQITRQAESWMARMTDGRYRSLVLDEQLSLRAMAEEENVLSDALWRSDGTVDQLYLSLRLAVAKLLTPEAPLVLDDALVRFDDKRLVRALEILRELAEEKQILLFTCQDREKRLLETL